MILIGQIDVAYENIINIKSGLVKPPKNESNEYYADFCATLHILSSLLFEKTSSSFQKRYVNLREP